jgi:hypothetical protein
MICLQQPGGPVLLRRIFRLFMPEEERIPGAIGRASGWEAWPVRLRAGPPVESSRTPLGAVAIARHQVKERAAALVIGGDRVPIVAPVHEVKEIFVGPLQGTRRT